MCTLLRIKIDSNNETLKEKTNNSRILTFFVPK